MKFRNHKKTDKIDAKLIADVLRVGYIPEVYIVNHDIQKKREVLRLRIKIIQDRCRVIFRLKALLDKLGENSIGDFATLKRLDKIVIESLPREYQYIVQEHIEQIKKLLQSENQIDTVIKKLVKTDKEASLLKTIDGVGDFSALLIKSEIADISRFKTFDGLCSYAGLAPRVFQSGNKTRMGALNKNRRKSLQWILLEIAPLFIKQNKRYEIKFEEIKKIKGYNKAKVVAARDLLRIIYRILRTKEPYYKEKNQSVVPYAVCGV